jgi:hypothetical protein
MRRSRGQCQGLHLPVEVKVEDVIFGSFDLKPPLFGRAFWIFKAYMGFSFVDGLEMHW